MIPNDLNAKWAGRFMDLCEHVASWSKDPSTQTGAVIVRPDKTVASIGYNGFPRGIPDRPEWLADRKVKYTLIVHCEMNALISAYGSVQGCTLFTWPFATCERCAVHMIQAGITAVVFPQLLQRHKERWQESLNNAMRLYHQAGVSTLQYSRYENGDQEIQRLMERDLT